LFFDESGSVFVLTDASDCGVGAYIYQKVDGQERPVIFLSKALQGTQLNWSTINKEAYAIFYTLKTDEYLLRDIKFTLRTDHLTYLNVESTQKVRRWKLLIQEFNFDVEHIPGEENEVNDAFSRLCVRESSENDSSKPFSLTYR
jgi:DNA-dependent RNA polymerase auxiliary subunit epsilon